MLRIFYFLSILLLFILSSNASAQGGAPDVQINEIRIDQTSTDNDEYFELKGAAGTSLNGLTYIVLGDGIGGSGVIECVINLDGRHINPNGYFVAAEPTFTLGIPDTNVGTNGLNFENSDNVTHVLVYQFTGSNNQDLDTDDNGVLDVTPWTSIVDLIALIEEQNPPDGSTEWHYGPPTVGPDGSFVPGHAYRFSNGNNWAIGPFDPSIGVDTPGAANFGTYLSLKVFLQGAYR